jgi:hypothetical protein
MWRGTSFNGVLLQQGNIWPGCFNDTGGLACFIWGDWNRSGRSGDWESHHAASFKSACDKTRVCLGTLP